MCESHADRLIVARGWELDDRRVSEPRLFSVDQADRAAAGRVRRLAQPEAHPSTPLPLDGGPLYALPSDYETPPPAPLTPMPTGTVVPTTGPAAPDAQTAANLASDKRPRSDDWNTRDPFDEIAFEDSDLSDADGNDSGIGSRGDAPRIEAPKRPASAKPKRRSHTDGNTPLLTRAFDAAASRVRPSSTMASLIPQTPPLPEPPATRGSSTAWPTIRFS